RYHRDLLRSAMEAEGFTVYEAEWWHFDYKDWKKYPILNISFEEINTAKTLFDFESPADIKAWSNLTLTDAKWKEPAATFEQPKDHAPSGKHSLKTTSAGGNWPTLTTKQIPADLGQWESISVDVNVPRACIVGLCVMQEKSRRGGDWDGAVSRWVK